MNKKIFLGISGLLSLAVITPVTISSCSILPSVKPVIEENESEEYLKILYPDEVRTNINSNSIYGDYQKLKELIILSRNKDNIIRDGSAQYQFIRYIRSFDFSGSKKPSYFNIYESRTETKYTDISNVKIVLYNVFNQIIPLEKYIEESLNIDHFDIQFSVTSKFENSPEYTVDFNYIIDIKSRKELFDYKANYFSSKKIKTFDSFNFNNRFFNELKDFKYLDTQEKKNFSTPGFINILSQRLSSEQYFDFDKMFSDDLIIDKTTVKAKYYEDENFDKFIDDSEKPIYDFEDVDFKNDKNITTKYVGISFDIKTLKENLYNSIQAGIIPEASDSYHSKTINLYFPVSLTGIRASEEISKIKSKINTSLVFPASSYDDDFKDKFNKIEDFLVDNELIENEVLNKPEWLDMNFEKFYRVNNSSNWVKFDNNWPGIITKEYSFRFLTSFEVNDDYSKQNIFKTQYSTIASFSDSDQSAAFNQNVAQYSYFTGSSFDPDSAFLVSFQTNENLKHFYNQAYASKNTDSEGFVSYENAKDLLNYINSDTSKGWNTTSMPYNEARGKSNLGVMRGSLREWPSLFVNGITGASSNQYLYVKVGFDTSYTYTGRTYSPKRQITIQFKYDDGSTAPYKSQVISMNYYLSNQADPNSDSSYFDFLNSYFWDDGSSTKYRYSVPLANNKHRIDTRISTSAYNNLQETIFLNLLMAYISSGSNINDSNYINAARGYFRSYGIFVSNSSGTHKGSFQNSAGWRMNFPEEVQQNRQITLSGRNTWTDYYYLSLHSIV